jgi:hypothetical protein
VAAARSLKQFEANKKFQVLVGGGRAKTILALNNKRKPLDDVRVRRAIRRHRPQGRHRRRRRRFWRAHRQLLRARCTRLRGHHRR